jgi:ABC-type lipoprotein export system ATPase subunit
VTPARFGARGRDPACGGAAPDAHLTARGYRGPVTVVAARGLVKTYGRGRAAHRVLDGADFTARAGELVAVVGRSGSGKSTLLHLLGALDRPDAGVIEVAGERVDGRPERELTLLRRRRVGFVFQFFHLVPELTGEENVLLPTRLKGSAPDAAARGRALVERLGLAAVSGRRPHELSGGEQQRLAVARALVQDPPLVLADEPTGNLDAEAGAAVLGLLRGAADEGRAVVLVTHDDAATAAADRVLRLRDGRLEP